MGAAVVVYSLLAAVALAWTLLRRQSPLSLSADAAWLSGALPLPTRVAVSAVLGLALGLVAVRGTKELVRRTRWAERLHIELRARVGPLTGARIAFFALMSGVSEELFFRGALQPLVGIWLTSLVFGAVHIGPTRAFVPWTLWAAVMGLLFGTVYQATGSLAGPVLAHVLINYENLHYLVSYDPVTVARERRITPESPSLVGPRVRTSGRSTPADPT
ncbi:MAG: CPBP family intramembrane metalloprotease [Sandaracinaceae bacterium]|nr:CPBP family intramembrane metalloprotease [Sandaracinaceae bacterium]